MRGQRCRGVRCGPFTAAVVGARPGTGTEGAQHQAQSLVGLLMASQHLLGPWVCAASPRSSSSPDKLGESRRAEFCSRWSHLESQCLQQVTDIVTHANLPPRAGVFSQDFQDPTVWKQQGACCPETHTQPRGSRHVCPVLPEWTCTWDLSPTTALQWHPLPIQIWFGPFPPGLGAHPNTFSAGPLRLSMRRTWHSSLGLRKCK